MSDRLLSQGGTLPKNMVPQGSPAVVGDTAKGTAAPNPALSPMSSPTVTRSLPGPMAPMGPQGGGPAFGGYTGTQARGLTSPGGTEQMGGNPNEDPTSTLGLPVEADPAYAIFAANSGLQRDLSRIGVAQGVPEYQRQANVGLQDSQDNERLALQGADTQASQRGLTRSGMAVQRTSDIEGRYGRQQQDIAQGAQNKIDTLRQQGDATERNLGAQGAQQAFSAVGRTAG